MHSVIINDDKATQPPTGPNCKIHPQFSCMSYSYAIFKHENLKGSALCICVGSNKEHVLIQQQSTHGVFLSAKQTLFPLHTAVKIQIVP